VKRTAIPEIKRSFAPVVNGATRVLVLGSLPGEASLRLQQYYAHPRNQFWRLMEPVVGGNLNDLAYPLRLERLLSAGIGLWDVIGSARRSGSLDTAIRDIQANTVLEMVGRLPHLRLVAFNGRKAADLGRKQLQECTGLELLTLPSSSPALTLPLQQKHLEWNRIGKFMADGWMTPDTAAIAPPCNVPVQPKAAQRRESPEQKSMASRT
jgi:hypoxanthine-DNA glycosylase